MGFGMGNGPNASLAILGAGTSMGNAGGYNNYNTTGAGAANSGGMTNGTAMTSPLTPMEKANLEERLDLLQKRIIEIKLNGLSDHRINVDGETGKDDISSQPAWMRQWRLDGKAPVMQFELLPGETVKDALNFAGGFALQAFSGSLTLRRMNASGSFNIMDVPAEDMGKFTLLRGDVLTALPLQGSQEGEIGVAGWVRVRGTVAWKKGQRVGDLLKNMALVLPDTYMERGELVRTTPDGSKSYLAFNVARALAGDTDHNLPLENRDAITLYRIDDMRRPLTLTVIGPVSKPGKFEYINGMRASDLLFRAGVPLENADQFVAELARNRNGAAPEVLRLDLRRLVSNAAKSPVDLKDDRLNPPLLPLDQISIFAKPDYREHRTITLIGQVARPGSYELDSPNASLRDIIKRAGGLTPEAMPSAGIFLRSMGGSDPEKRRANLVAGVENADPTSNGINEILKRLSETMRLPGSGAIETNPLLHGLTAGSLNRLVMNLPGLLAGDPAAEVELQDRDEIIIPRRTDVAYVVGETASPFAAYKVNRGTEVKNLIDLAGGPTRNADTWHIRLLKADGRIIDGWWVGSRKVEPGDAILVPQRIRRDVSWQENLAALTPVAILINALRN
jgi:protein involved in polysaccharide export with SLBB domain